MNSPTIIIVEDELIIAMDLKRILTQEGFNVIINFKNYNFKETIFEIEKYNPVLVILDINLNQKEFDGIAIAQHLLVNDLVPFIFITGISDKEMVERIKTTRPHGIMIKPFKPIDVTCTIAVVLNNYKYKNIDVLRLNNKIVNDIPFILKPVIKYIELHIDHRIDIRILAELTNYNYMHFIRMFTLYMNITPYQYILQMKIEKAKFLITETNQLLTHIAFDLSFSSYSNFCTIFKRLTGYTPDAYRKINSAKNYINK
jgi:AraC-like DNA-binding protein/AmiR/NasT family two-component response regulator